MSTMQGSSSARPWVAAGILLATLVAGGVVPESRLDRWLFSRLAQMIHPSPQWVSGFGTRQTPWTLRHFDPQAGDLRSHAPAMVRVGDDPDRVFQSSPLSPLDFAVMFSNLRRLGVEHAGCSVILAWDSPDMIGLTALEKSLDGFGSMGMAVPLTRGSVAEPMPPAFRGASLPLSCVVGNVNALPVVNRVAVPDTVLGRRCAAGFSTLECEPDDGFPFVCARWEDRIVLSYALWHVLRHLDIAPESLEIRLGECLRIGRRGPVVPIDERGRLCVKPAVVDPVHPVSAEDLIDAPDGFFPAHVPEPVILADTRGMADAAGRAYTVRLPGEIAAMAGEAGLTPARTYPRPPVVVEWLLIEASAFALASLLWLPRLMANFALLLFVSLACALQWCAFTLEGAWLPGASMLVPLAIAAPSIQWMSLKLASARGNGDTAPRGPD